MQIKDKSTDINENNYHFLIDNVSNIIGKLDPDGIITYINPYIYRELGYKSEEVIGRELYEFIFPTDVKKVTKMFQKRTKSDITITDIRIKDKNNQFVWFDIEARKVKDNQNEKKVIISLKKITKFKDLEQELKQSEKKYRTLVEDAQEGVWALDENENTTLVNPRICEMLGYTKEEMMGKNLHGFIPDSMEALIERNRARRRKGVKETYEFQLVKKDGTIIDTEVKAAPITSENGKYQGSFAYITDITNRKLTEQKLKESERKYRDLIETSTMGLLEIDVKKEGVIYINPRLLEIIGYTKEELLNEGMFIKSIFSEDPLRIEEPIEKDVEFRLITKEGETKWLSGRTINQSNEQGELKSIRLWLQDITKAKELEEIKSNLLTRISHELKTPLISIKGFTDLLLTDRREDLNKKAISYLNRIKDGGNRLKSLIDDFIESTYLDKNLVRLTLSYVNLANLIKNTIKDLEGLIKLRKIKIKTDIHDDLMNYVDKGKIQSVISNLLTNAVKFTPQQGKIFIKSKVRKSEMIISISDSGIGLQKEDMINLFKPFGKIERYGRGWDIIADGIGLGLYLAKEIIDLHNGKIWAKSKGLNKGSTFYILLPIIRSLEPEE